MLLSVIGCIIMYIARADIGVLFGTSNEVNMEIAKIIPVFLISVPFVSVNRIATASFYATEKIMFSYISTFAEPIFMIILGSSPVSVGENLVSTVSQAA